MSREIHVENMSPTIEPASPIQETRDISIRTIALMYTVVGLALSAAYFANKEYDRAAFTLTCTAPAILGFRIRD